MEIQCEAQESGGAAIGVKYTHKGPGGCAMIQMGVALDGSQMQFWPIRGMQTNPKEPAPMVSAFLISDRERMWGRECPKCHAYFRTNHPEEYSICPYCACRARNDEFTTKNQRAFIDQIRRGYIEAWESKRDVVLDLDAIADALPENRPTWVYNEERQQNTYTCMVPKCDTRYDVLGRYAGCPTCGRRNSLQVFVSDLAKLNDRVETVAAEEDVTVEPDFVSRAFSDFEAMAKDLQGQLAILPLTPRRRKMVKGLSFQRLEEAAQSIEAWFGIDMWASVSSAEKAFILQWLARRHLFVHNGGRVDEKYLAQTNDTTVRLHQQIEVRSSDVREVMRVLRICAEIFFTEYESIGH